MCCLCVKKQIRVNGNGSRLETQQSVINWSIAPQGAMVDQKLQAELEKAQEIASDLSRELELAQTENKEFVQELVDDKKKKTKQNLLSKIGGMGKIRSKKGNTKIFSVSKSEMLGIV